MILITKIKIYNSYIITKKNELCKDHCPILTNKYKIVLY